ncbi:AbrB/MazE/SpoVT family DNA-binding domain-containing protein [Roseateles sp.]|jgi:AbrB family looped-hinge helix DNA binding protein|uniref:AbrB/MazE/SpoVT family DNA-binding domain-containing protein n=1 Tax=Roseateles sp. TaxID=1971397 RepID=UPI0031D2E311
MPAPTAELSPRHRIELPKELRSSLNWKPGQKLMLVQHKNGVFVSPLISPDEVFGIGKGANTESYRDRSDRY